MRRLYAEPAGESAVLGSGRRRAGGEDHGYALAIGDFNTCRAYVDEPGAIDRCAYFLDRVAEVGFCDLWRQRYPESREFSWSSRSPAFPNSFASSWTPHRELTRNYRSNSQTGITVDPYPRAPYILHRGSYEGHS